MLPKYCEQCGRLFVAEMVEQVISGEKVFRQKKTCGHCPIETPLTSQVLNNFKETELKHHGCRRQLCEEWMDRLCEEFAKRGRLTIQDIKKISGAQDGFVALSTFRKYHAVYVVDRIKNNRGPAKAIYSMTYTV